jgi:thiamine-monophosphate kinase
MTPRGLSEREIIAILRKQFDIKLKLPLGFDDDVAALPSGKSELIILKSDMLVGETDIPPGMTLRQAARKAVVATVSDFAAKGVQPKALLIALGLASPVLRESVNELSQGLSRAATEYGCRIIGGDTSQTNDLIIDCIGFGVTESGSILRRKGARPDDIVATTGDFGKTSAGLRILSARNKRMIRDFPGLVRSVLHPVAKLSTGIKLAKTGKVTSSIDSSDGLAWSLHEIARLSKVNIFLDNIPVAHETLTYAKTNRVDQEDLALYGGEEYELVFTLDRGAFESVKRKIPSIKRIGRVERGSGEVRARVRNMVRRVEARGYQHLSR